MKTTVGVCSAALLALTLVGSSSLAQETTAPANAPASDGADVTASPESSNLVSANSKVRIVRLSEVKGDVQIDRKTGQGFGSAMANLPVIEGDKLKTGDGVAEVEFEDNSTVRLAPNSLIEFPQLELLPSGAKASAVNVLQGMVYVSLLNTKGNEFTLTFGREKLNLPPDSHVRLDLTPNEAKLAVMHGNAVVEESSGGTEIGKNKTATFNLVSQSPPVVAKNVADNPLDSWDHDAVDYHKSYANASSFGNSPYSYGINDMNYYGSFINAGACGGSLWRPYFTSANWDPFANGAWAYYPSAGYSWVSPYPWGWTPYHSGSWAYCQGVGWGWRPGGGWMGLANAPLGLANAPGAVLRPRPPAQPPLAGHPTALVPVNNKPLNTSSLSATHDSFVFRGDSAGMGVPRGSLGKLNSFSNQAGQHGMASTSVYYAPRGPEQGRGGFEPRSGVEGRAGNEGPAYSHGPASMSRTPPNSGMQNGGTQNSGMQNSSMQNNSMQNSAAHNSMQNAGGMQSAGSAGGAHSSGAPAGSSGGGGGRR
jgi:hypothetical protein